MSKHDVKWLYHSPIGEIEIWAATINEVLINLWFHGFTQVDKTKIELAALSNVEQEEIR